MRGGGDSVVAVRRRSLAVAVRRRSRVRARVYDTASSAVERDPVWRLQNTVSRMSATTAKPTRTIFGLFTRRPEMPPRDAIVVEGDMCVEGDMWLCDLGGGLDSLSRRLTASLSKYLSSPCVLLFVSESEGGGGGSVVAVRRRSLAVAVRRRSRLRAR